MGETQSTEAVMPTSTEATTIRRIRKQLALDGVSDPFAIAAEAMARAERLEAEVRRLNALLSA
jgi:hypothetical protein